MLMEYQEENGNNITTFFTITITNANTITTRSTPGCITITKTK